MAKNKITFHGIIVAGNDKEDVISKYVSVAKGQQTVALADYGESVLFISHSDTDEGQLANPLSGNMDLIEANNYLNEMKFVAESSDIKTEPHLTICAGDSGCGSYILYDSPKLIKHCPVCASDEIRELSEEEIAEYEKTTESSLAGDIEDYEIIAEDEDYDDEDEGDIEVEEEINDEDYDEEEEGEVEIDEEITSSNILTYGKTADIAISKYRDIMTQETDFSLISSNGNEESRFITISGDGFKFNPFDSDYAVANKIKKDNLTGFLKSLSSSNQDALEANYFICCEDNCGTHVVASSEDPLFCPVCCSALIEPDNKILSKDDEEEESEEEESEEEESEEEESEEDTGENEDEGEEENEEEGEEENEEEEDIDLAVSSNENNKIKLKIPDLIVESNSDSSKLEVAYCGSINKEPSWVAFYDGIPVAKATAASAHKHSDIFEDPAFANALIASAKENGIQQGLTDMGFMPLTIDVGIKENMDKLVQEAVASNNEKLQSEINQEREEYEQRLMSALSIASMGINKGFFKNSENKLKQALWNSLSSAGMRNPEKMIDNVFNKYSDDYHKTLFSKAREITAKSLDVQNELANAVMDSNYSYASGSNNESLEDRMEGIGNPVVEEQAVASDDKKEENNKGGISKDKIIRVVSSLGRR